MSPRERHTLKLPNNSSANLYKCKAHVAKYSFKYGLDILRYQDLLGNLPYRTYSKHSWGLTHWGRVTHICVRKLTIIGSDNGLTPGWRQAIIWTNVRIWLIGPLGTNFSEILIEICIFLSRNCMWKCRQEVGGHLVSALIFIKSVRVIIAFLQASHCHAVVAP